MAQHGSDVRQRGDNRLADQCGSLLSSEWRWIWCQWVYVAGFMFLLSAIVAGTLDNRHGEGVVVIVLLLFSCRYWPRHTICCENFPRVGAGGRRR